MLNEWTEFLQYTQAMTYSADAKNDRAYLGRFTYEMLLGASGLARVMTIIARGYLFHERDGNLTQSPRERTYYARRALCAWCSIPPVKKGAQEESRPYKSDFPELHGEFPELVDKKGGGWFYRHVHAVVAFVDEHPEVARKSAAQNCDALMRGFDKAWRKKVLQYQASLYSLQTDGEWALKFDSILVDALELGPLRQDEPELPPELLTKLDAVTPKEVPAETMRLLLGYYIVNKPEDSDWVVLPAINFDAFCGTGFSKKQISKIPLTFMERSNNFGVSRYRVLPEYLPQGEQE